MDIYISDLSCQIFSGLYSSSGSTAARGCMKQSVVKPPIMMDLQPSQGKLARHFRERLESVGMIHQSCMISLCIYF